MKMQTNSTQTSQLRTRTLHTSTLRVSVLDRLKAKDAEGYALVFALWDIAEAVEQRRAIEKAWARRERKVTVQSGRSERPMKSTLPARGGQDEGAQDFGVRVAISARPIPNPTTKLVYQS